MCSSCCSPTTKKMSLNMVQSVSWKLAKKLGGVVAEAKAPQYVYVSVSTYIKVTRVYTQ